MSSTTSSPTATIAPVRLSNFAVFALWFGAAVSAAELQAGGALAGMDRWAAIAAIGLGHLAGGLAMFFVAKISWRRDLPAMEALRPSFGLGGMATGAVLNILQLIGWTMIMIILASNSLVQLADAMGLVVAKAPWFGPLTRVVVGGLLLAWTLFGFKGMQRVNTYTVLLLFGLTIAAAIAAFGSPFQPATAGASVMGFGAAFDMAFIMPLSWLPLVGDYTRQGTSKAGSALAAALGYGIGSVWMYLIGFASASATGNYDPSLQMIKLGLGALALIVVVLATVTTGFLDLFSAVQSSLSLIRKIQPRLVALLLGVGAMIGAILLPDGYKEFMDGYQGFLYFIGSVFGPLYGVLLADGFTRSWLQRGGQNAELESDKARLGRYLANGSVWLLGWLAYQFLIPKDFVIGQSVPALVGAFILQIIVLRGVRLWVK